MCKWVFQLPKKINPLPSHESIKKRCDRMANFFSEKIKVIHAGLTTLQDSSFALHPDEVFQSEHCFIDFTPVTEEEVGNFIKGTAPKSCCLDPVPTIIVISEVGTDLCEPLYANLNESICKYQSEYHSQKHWFSLILNIENGKTTFNHLQSSMIPPEPPSPGPGII